MDGRPSLASLETARRARHWTFRSRALWAVVLVHVVALVLLLTRIFGAVHGDHTDDHTVAVFGPMVVMLVAGVGAGYLAWSVARKLLGTALLLLVMTGCAPWAGVQYVAGRDGGHHCLATLPTGLPDDYVRLTARVDVVGDVVECELRGSRPGGPVVESELPVLETVVGIRFHPSRLVRPPGELRQLEQ